MAQWKIPPDLHTRTIGGPLCFHKDHNIGSKDGRIARYDDSHACVKCIAALTEGRFKIDVHSIDKKHRRKFLEFWSMVDIRGPDDCWPWMGKTNSIGQAIYNVSRHWTGGTGWSAQRSAVWFSHGDVGRLPIKAICRNPHCMNPLHLRVKGVPHFFHRRKLSDIDLEFNSRKLVGETSLFLQTTQLKDPLKFKEIARHNEIWINARINSGDALDPEEMAMRVIKELSQNNE